MKTFANVFAILLLALEPAALLSVSPARAQPAGREARRGEARGGERRPEARANEGRGGAYGVAPYVGPAPAPLYRGPAPPAGAYGQRYPGYPPPYAPVPAPGYAYAPPRVNSLGAEWAQQQDQARMGVRQGRLMPLGQVMLRLRRATPGRLLDAGLEPGPDGRAAYRVRWAAAGGRRIDFIVDAVTGQVLSRSGY